MSLLFNIKKHRITSCKILAIFFTGLWLVFSGEMKAQVKSFSEIAITAGGPGSSLNYGVEGADVSQSPGFNFGIEYTYNFNNNFGISLGTEFQHFKSEVKAFAISGNYQTTDFEMESFEFRYSMRSFKEEQTVGFINIPIMFVYQNQEYDFYVRAGAKIGLPLSGKFKSGYNLYTSGYYPQYNAELFDPAFMGFGEFNNVQANGDLNIKPTYIASVELGIKQSVGKSNLYIGFYLDYGLNDIADKKNRLADYTVNDSGAGFKYNSVLNTEYVDEIKTMAFGVKLRYSVFKF
ncbi:outer membrane beta-barrel protein [Flavobacterium rakeshii]|uniref:outer membrane beta-barrel protein n=1 Tax=Flavobacterium rakeshii TaxID=1038845 RepID=UPI002E7B6AF8|nr:outer membrane beta-barrel protein [Flavobacterium rakeshii]MEE1898213.1 outer membrane beta-barrel protein [Flavobacterium rakeshii]